MWHIRPEFKHYLEMGCTGLDDDDDMKAKSMSGAAAGLKKRKKPEDGEGDVEDRRMSVASVTSQGKGSAKSPAPTPQPAGSKRKSTDGLVQKKITSFKSTPTTSGAKDTGSGEGPRKPRRAFWYFVKANRPTAEALEPNASVSFLVDIPPVYYLLYTPVVSFLVSESNPEFCIQTADLKDKLTKMWDQLDQSARVVYEKSEADDLLRYPTVV